MERRTEKTREVRAGAAKERRMFRRVLAGLLAAALLSVLLPEGRAWAYVKHDHAENLMFDVDGGGPCLVKTLHYGYTNNRYVSIRDMASALAGTALQYEVSISAQEIALLLGQAYRPSGGEGEGFVFPEDPDEEFSYTTENFRQMAMTVDGREVRYFTFLGKNGAGNLDAYISLTDLALILDADLWIEDGRLRANTAGSFYIDMDVLDEQGFYYEVYSALVGDASTGEIYASYRRDLGVPIASTTKLMTYLCVMDAVTAGEMSLSDTVTLSENAETLSGTSDGVIEMEAGQMATVTDLLYGMLLPSSNECALALAEHLDGEEAQFTLRMNRKAAELGLSSATVFYNCHGLPVFSDTVTASKIQNHMCAQDMFLLVSHILAVYPQIKEITSTRERYLESLNYYAKNTNPLLYNLPGVVGLKTGTTYAAGACLVSAYDIAENGETHTIVAMEFGAEDAAIRCTFSEILLRYGIQSFEAAESSRAASGASELALPTTAEGLIRRILEAERK